MIDEHLHRLHLTSIATVPSVTLTLLPRLLAKIRSVIQSYPSAQISQRDELIQALFKELSHNVGDAEKEYVMAWWYENKEDLVGRAISIAGGPEHDSGTQHASLVSRL